MAFQISDIVRVDASVSAGGATRREFGRTLFLTTDDTLPGGGPGKVQSFATKAEVDAVFPAASAPAQAATAYFGQSPRPRNFLVGRWVNTEFAATVITGNVPITDTLANGLGQSNYSMRFDGENLASIDLSSVTTGANLAAGIQNSLQGVRGASTKWGTVTAALQAGTNLPGHHHPERRNTGLFSAGGTGTATLAASLGLNEGNATYRQGATQETLAGALNNIAAIDNGFTYVTIDTTIAATPQNIIDTAAWAEAGNYLHSAPVFGDAATVTGETGSVAATLFDNQYTRTWASWRESPDYFHVGIAGVLAAVNLSQPNSLITAAFRTVAGFGASDITTTERTELERKRINYYAQYGDAPIFWSGIMLRTGLFIDTQLWLDWARNAIQTAIWNQLRASTVPQTASGVAAIRASITTALEDGVVNGGIAPGTVSPDFIRDIRDTTGSQDFDGFLSQGFLVHIGSLARQSQTDRAARKLPPTKVWAKGSGAIHEVDISLVFEN